MTLFASAKFLVHGSDVKGWRFAVSSAILRQEKLRCWRQGPDFLSPLPRRLRFAFGQEPDGKFAAPFRDGDNKEKDEETPCGKLNSSQLDRTKAMHILENALEIERLALVALQLVAPKPGNEEDLEKDFQLALPRAYRLLQLITEE
jgi:hypothetical protein